MGKEDLRTDLSEVRRDGAHYYDHRRYSLHLPNDGWQG